jgi:hypothetical protein
MDKVQKTISSQCYIPSSERFRIYNTTGVSVWTVETLHGSRNNHGFDSVNRKLFLTPSVFHFFICTGTREVWAQAPTLRMAVWAEGALLATESHWPVWEGSSYVLLLLRSGKHRRFIYIYIYCIATFRHKARVDDTKVWMYRTQFGC